MNKQNISIFYFLEFNSSTNVLTEANLYDVINCFIYLICAILSTFLNIPLIIKWIFFCKKNNYADLILITMAVADFINGIFICPSLLIMKLNQINFIKLNFINTFFQFFEDSIDNALTAITLSSMFILSLHRLKLLKTPFKEKTKFNRFRIAIITLIWLISIITNFASYLISYYIKRVNIFYLIWLIVSLYIPSISIVILNIIIIINFTSKIKNKNFNRSDFKKEKKAILCTLSINITLLLFYFPSLILYPFKLYNYEFVEYFHEIYYSISYSYIFINPLIVLIFNRRFRLKIIGTRLSGDLSNRR